MLITVKRLKDNGKATISVISIDDIFECFGIEDTHRDVKVKGETCVPKGTYELKLRTVGGMSSRYAKKYDNHKGMLWLKNIPGFKWVYFHVGNTAAHSEGCILVNGAVDSLNMTGSKSAVVYTKFYDKIISAIDNGQHVSVSIE